MVSIDLKERNGRLILYMIDVVTHYTRAIFIKSKKKDVIVDMIIQLWMSIFGAANMFLMDNGDEFANDELRELGNQFGINIKHTAAHAPWANGINECNHASIDIMIEKMLENLTQLSEETALQYAVSIRNCSMYVNGFITTLSIEKRVRNYSEFTRKRVAKKTGPWQIYNRFYHIL